MAKQKKASGVIKSKSLFDLIDCVSVYKTPWSDLTESDRKTFSIYMIQRFLSMDPDLTGVVNYLQQYTLIGMPVEQVYKLYLDLLPKKKLYFKYIKSSKTDDSKLSPQLVEFVKGREWWSSDECYDNLNQLLSTGPGRSDLIAYLKQYGFSDSEIKKQFKL